jgi:hypothetical protein
MIYALVSMFWFYQMNLLVVGKKIPKWLRSFTIHFVCPTLRLPKFKTVTEKGADGEDVVKTVEYTANECTAIFNDFAFYCFFAYFVLMNLVLLVIFPVFVQAPLTLLD